MTMKANSLLKVSDLVAGYGDVKVLMGINVELKQNEMLAMVGPNGAGKSTLLRCISGLLTTKDGEIWFLETQINNLSYLDIVKSGIILCPEGGKVFPEMNVEDNLLLGGYLSNKKERKEQLDFVYNLFPVLKERYAQIAGTLSGGERQMLGLGRGLMSRPKLLMMDEPSFGLAPLMKKTIYKAIDRMNKKEGIAILLVEQDAKLALEFASRAYVLENGKVAMEGNPEALLNNGNFQKIYLGI
jgi:branched-chain amino acid transport system ATP-binding protein